MPDTTKNHASQPEHYLDITSDICPMTFVKTKLFIERLQIGEILEVRLKGAEPLENVPRSVRDHGHEVISLLPEENLKTTKQDVPYRLVIRKV